MATTLNNSARLKTFWLLLFIGYSRLIYAAESLPGEPFQPAESGFEIVWNDKLEELPETSPYYTASGHRFNQRLIEYFKNAGNFSSESKVTPPDHWESRKDTEIYDKDSKFLSVFPMTGSLSYNNNQNGSDLSLPEAPDVETAKELTKKLLLELGFDLAALSFDKITFTKETSTRYDKTTEKAISRTIMTGMSIPRLYEGHPSNHGGINVSFGLGGVLTNFSICWRDVKLAGLRKVPSREEIVKLTLAGHATVMMDAAQNANKLTIKKISVIYREAEPFKKAGTVDPFLLIKADAEVNGETADCTLYLKLQ